MTQILSRSQLGALDKLGQGGQGVVYRAPLAQTTFAKSMVYKEYRPAVISTLSVDALGELPEFLESLPYRDGARLISLASWPCALVEDAGRVSGFIMPSIPDEFFTDFWTSSKPGPSRVSAEFQHLLNDPQVVAARFGGVVVSERQELELLRAVASALLFLHERGVCVGDISPKNLLFSLNPVAAVYFVDCDAMRVNGISLSPQVETPGWEVPVGEERATVFSDRYKLGLLALRLILGSQDAKDPARLPGWVPSPLRQVITRTLSSQPDQRPSLSEWDQTLRSAIASAPQAVPPPPPPPPPPLPQPPPPTPQVNVLPGAQAGQPAGKGNNKMAWLMIPAALLALFFIVKLASGQSGETSPQGSATPYAYPATATTVVTPEPVVLPAGTRVCSNAAGMRYETAAVGNDHTSCPFAEGVRLELSRTSGMLPRSVIVYSPVTQQTYDMYCTGGSPVITCRGGNDAVVYVY